MRWPDQVALGSQHHASQWAYNFASQEPPVDSGEIKYLTKKHNEWQKKIAQNKYLSLIFANQQTL